MTPELSRGSFFYPGPITVQAIQSVMLKQFDEKLVSLTDFAGFESFRDWWQESLMDDDVDTFRPLFVQAFDGLTGVAPSVQHPSYESIIDSYKSTLRKNRGKVIDLGGGTYAVMDPRNQLIRFDADIAGDFSSGFEGTFKERDYDQEVGAWDGMSQESTLASFEKPKLLIIPQE